MAQINKVNKIFADKQKVSLRYEKGVLVYGREPTNYVQEVPKSWTLK